jgi:predicted metal-dependent phosphoesterase TrpH
MIDLHTHTAASDGTDTPADLIAAAMAVGLQTIALTDHDTTAGWDAASEAVRSAEAPISLIRGTEFSCVYVRSSGERVGLHLLGYLYDPDAPELKAERSRLRENRLSRGERIVRNLSEAGYPVSWGQVTDIAAGGVVGRPHIGQALVRSGVVASVDQAFAELLTSSSPYYVPKEDMAVADAVRMVRSAGGVPVIAHPWARRRGKVLTVDELAELVEHGLLGMEVDHPDHDGEDRRTLRGLATDWGLIRTGSSDYHGTNKPTVLAAEMTEPEELDRILYLATGLEPVRSESA